MQTERLDSLVRQTVQRMRTVTRGDGEPDGPNAAAELHCALLAPFPPACVSAPFPSACVSTPFAPATSAEGQASGIRHRRPQPLPALSVQDGTLRTRHSLPYKDGLPTGELQPSVVADLPASLPGRQPQVIEASDAWLRRPSETESASQTQHRAKPALPKLSLHIDPVKAGSSRRC